MNGKLTARECSRCEDGKYIKQGTELYCNRCQYAPERMRHSPKEPPWVSMYSAGNGKFGNDRVRMPGGYFHAYYGDGIYGD